MHPRPSKVVCIGRNYLEHARELGNDVPSEPLIFLKPPSSIIGDGDFIELPRQSGQVDHEGEIGIVMARRIRHADEAEAVAAIRGVAPVNDVTARDLQRKDGQWTRAKGFDTFCPIGAVYEGPVDLGNLEVITRVNGSVRQRANSAEMAFSIPLILSYVSSVMTLEAGDIIATGTPAGISALNAGDVVEVEIVGVGTVRNPVRAMQ